jgi:UDP-N-acetylglucosamine/UDP-N-acetylgalactosamine diphosphorylase
MRQELISFLSRFGQNHLLDGWEQLDPSSQAALATELKTLDLPLLQQLFRERTAEVLVPPEPPQPPAVEPLPRSPADQAQRRADRDLGEQLLRAGTVAVVLVAGGQGSRLGHEGPKGTYPIGPVTQRSLFQWHAEKVLALSRRYGVAMPLAIMTSADNDAATRQFFAAQHYFGLDPTQVCFFIQGMMPALDATTGRVLRMGPGQLVLCPNGHGGVLPALRDAGLLDVWQQRGIEHVFYFQVDNPLVKVADPIFLGAHVRCNSEVSVKVVRKTDPAERIGLVVRRSDGRHAIMEYSELPPELAARRTDTGELYLSAGSTAIHIFSLPFLQRLARERVVLPYHRALKAVPHEGDPAPTRANAIKFEMFIFDALPLAERVLVLETDRAEEFEPLKNADGPYSPQTVRAALSAEFARWLEAAGCPVPRDAAGQPAFPIEISPLFARDAEELRCRIRQPLAITGPLCLESDDLAPVESETSASGGTPCGSS